jgi:hypothetical protein
MIEREREREREIVCVLARVRAGGWYVVCSVGLINVRCVLQSSICFTISNTFFQKICVAWCRDILQQRAGSMTKNLQTWSWNPGHSLRNCFRWVIFCAWCVSVPLVEFFCHKGNTFPTTCVCCWLNRTLFSYYVMTLLKYLYICSISPLCVRKCLYKASYIVTDLVVIELSTLKNGFACLIPLIVAEVLKYL